MYTIEGCIAEFERKSKYKWTVEPDEVIVFDPAHGAFGYVIDVRRNRFFLTKCVGDGMWWMHRLDALFRTLQPMGIKCVEFITKRNPATYIRRFGATVTDSRMDEGSMSYRMELDFDTFERRYKHGQRQQFGTV